MKKEWFWEGNINKSFCEYLRKEKWDILKAANTKIHEKGIDIVAKRNRTHLVVEVKGYPSTKYQYGKNKGKLKPTKPNTQARHWFAEVILSIILAKNKYPNAKRAIALPNYNVYNKLIDKTKPELKLLQIGIFLVNKNGNVNCVS